MASLQVFTSFMLIIKMPDAFRVQGLHLKWALQVPTQVLKEQCIPSDASLPLLKWLFKMPGGDIPTSFFEEASQTSMPMEHLQLSVLT